jgi:prepilin-type N-terminal cleavage/methylation domain-containing protein
MNSRFPRLRRGFTLIELSIAMMLGLATGTMLLALFNQQLAFLKLYKSQNFLTASPVVVLNFRQPDGTMRATIISFENRGTGNALYYYVVPVSGVLGTPQWAVSKSPRNVSFAMESGILRMTLTGPNSEEITYSGTMQQ